MSKSSITFKYLIIVLLSEAIAPVIGDTPIPLIWHIALVIGLIVVAIAECCIFKD